MTDACHSLATSKVQYYFLFPCFMLKEVLYYLFHGIHSKPIASVYERGPSLMLFDDVSEEMRLGIIKGLRNNMSNPWDR